jgi:hypothetical protein
MQKTYLFKDNHVRQIEIDRVSYRPITKQTGEVLDKRKLRRLRPEEAIQLDALDDEIAALRIRRAELLKVAWQHGHTVTVKELVEKAKGES